MDKSKLIELITEAWNDGQNSYHDCKRPHEIKEDLDNYLSSAEDDINELCEGKKQQETEATALSHGVSHRKWSVDEIVEELKDIDAFDAAKYFFDKYGG